MKKTHPLQQKLNQPVHNQCGNTDRLVFTVKNETKKQKKGTEKNEIQIINTVHLE